MYGLVVAAMVDIFSDPDLGACVREFFRAALGGPAGSSAAAEQLRKLMRHPKFVRRIERLVADLMSHLTAKAELNAVLLNGFSGARLADKLAKMLEAAARCAPPAP